MTGVTFFNLSTLFVLKRIEIQDNGSYSINIPLNRTQFSIFRDCSVCFEKNLQKPRRNTFDDTK